MEQFYSRNLTQRDIKSVIQHVLLREITPLLQHCLHRAQRGCCHRCGTVLWGNYSMSVPGWKGLCPSVLICETQDWCALANLMIRQWDGSTKNTPGVSQVEEKLNFCSSLPAYWMKERTLCLKDIDISLRANCTFKPVRHQAGKLLPVLICACNLYCLPQQERDLTYKRKELPHLLQHVE